MNKGKEPDIPFVAFYIFWEAKRPAEELAERFGCSLYYIDVLRKKFGFPKRPIDILEDTSFEGLLIDLFIEFDIDLDEENYQTILSFISNYDYDRYNYGEYAYLMSLWHIYYFFRLHCQSYISMDDYLGYLEKICYCMGCKEVKGRRIARNDISRHFPMKCTSKKLMLRHFFGFCDNYTLHMTDELRRKGAKIIMTHAQPGNPRPVVGGLLYYLLQGKMTQRAIAQAIGCSEVSVRNHAKYLSEWV